MATLPTAATLTPKSQGNSQPAAGAITFHAWKGWVDGINITVERDVRPGQSGSVAQGIGKRASDSKCVGIKFFASISDLTTFTNLVENSPSPFSYTILDPYGRLMTVRVCDATVQVQRCKGPANGAVIMLYQAQCTFTVERLPDV